MYWTREVDNMKIAAAGLYSLFLLTGLGDGTAAFGLNYDEPVSDYDYYYDVNLESISVEPGEEGFAIITITAVGCVNTTLKKIMVKSCDGEFTKEYFDKQCMDKLCLPNNFNKNCVRVKYGNVSSTNVILPPYKVYNHSKAPIANAWHHHHSTNTSRIWVLLMDGVFTYRLQLKPLVRPLRLPTPPSWP
ncbi:uncharacterized protein LOC121856887 [Homarus americanus]|uniref:uncharacterized protein LOC121856887 n=1 Tax=Homarus americanus TaxID=6706 RepID=UPI001C463023|nr:uncharacterized protein LOC121856887 [Homarus americanus]